MFGFLKGKTKMKRSGTVMDAGQNRKRGLDKQKIVYCGTSIRRLNQ